MDRPVKATRIRPRVFGAPRKGPASHGRSMGGCPEATRDGSPAHAKVAPASVFSRTLKAPWVAEHDMSPSNGAGISRIRGRNGWRPRLSIPLLAVLLAGVPPAGEAGNDMSMRAKETVTAVELDHGECLHFRLNSGRYSETLPVAAHSTPRAIKTWQLSFLMAI